MELALALEREPRAQITVHPDTDSPAEGVPGPATIPLSTRETVFWSPYWIGSFFVAMRQNLVMTLPWRSAKVLSELVSLTVLVQAQPGLLLVPHLIWHRHIDKDPALSWARCMMLDTLHVQPGRRGRLASRTAQRLLTRLRKHRFSFGKTRGRALCTIFGGALFR